MFLHYKLTAGLNVKFGPRYRGNSILQSRNKMSTKTSTVNMTECSSYYQKVYPRVSLLAELKDKKGSFQTITVKNFSHRCPCPIKLSKLYWKCMWREFLKSKAFVEGGRWLYEISVSRSIPTYFRASAWLYLKEMRIHQVRWFKSTSQREKTPPHVCFFTCSQRTVPLQSVWLSSQICQSCDPH